MIFKKIYKTYRRDPNRYENSGSERQNKPLSPDAVQRHDKNIPFEGGRVLSLKNRVTQ